MAASLLVLAPLAARADDLTGARSEDVREKEHVATVRLFRGHAEIVVRRTVANDGARHDQATYTIQIPQGAVATGLRTLAEGGGERRWFTADLMEATEAAKRYQELTGFGLTRPKDPALLYWRGAGELGLQVFPVAPGGTKTIEYTLEVPTAYREGRDVLELPVLGLYDSPAELVVQSGAPEDVVYEGDRRLGPGERIQTYLETLNLSLARTRPPPIGGSFAMVPLVRPNRALTHVRIEAAARVSETPHGAAVVVLLDASRSIGDVEARAQVTVARAFLSHFVDARVEVIAFHREIEARHGKLVPVDVAAKDLASFSPALKNGSNVDLALARADALLAATKKGTPRRVLLLTDLRTRATLTPGKLAQALAESGALLHVGVVGSGGPSLARDDEHAWARVPRATGGLLFRVTAPSKAASADIDPKVLDVFEELARPMRLEKLRVRGPGIATDTFETDQLAEGEAFEDLRVMAPPAGALDVSGELWSKPYAMKLVPDVKEAKLWSALGTAADSLGLTDDETYALAMRGNAVSPVTSFLAVEPGVRPSTEGLEHGGGIGLGNFGTLGAASGYGHASGISSPPFDHRLFLEIVLGRAFRACGGAGMRGAITVETTRAEVVDVPAVRVNGTPRTDIEACTREAAWKLLLPEAFGAEFASWTVALDPTRA